jgi:hypothetical protein
MEPTMNEAPPSRRGRLLRSFGSLRSSVAFADRFGPALAVAVLVVTAAIYAFSNYAVFADSDLKAYLFPARDMAGGTYPVNFPPFDALKDTIPREDRMFYPHFVLNRETDILVSYVGLGFPALLAVVIAVFGKMAVFYVNPVLFSLLPVLVYWMCHSTIETADRASARWCAAIGTAALFSVPAHVLSPHMLPFRDLALVTSLVVSTALLGKHRQRTACLVLGGIFAGYAAWIRASALMMIPLVVAYGALGRDLGGWKARGRLVLFAMGGLLLGIMPALLQNWHDYGSPFFFPQMWYLEFAMHNRGGDWDVQYLHKRLADYLILLFVKNTGWWFALFLAAGAAIAVVRRGSVAFFCLLTAVVSIAAAASGRQFWSRYQLVTYVMLAPVVATGALWAAFLLDRLVRKTKAGGAGAIAATRTAFVLLIGLMTVGWVATCGTKPKGRLTVGHATEFVAAINSNTVPGGVVICEPDTRSLIEFGSHCNALSLWNVADTNGEVAVKVDRLRDKGFHVYYFDAETTRMVGPRLSRAEGERALRRSHDLNLLASFDTRALRLAKMCGSDLCRLYEVTRLTNRIVSAAVEPADIAPFALRFDLGTLGKGARIKLDCRGHSEEFAARNWWNIVSIPPDAATNGATCRFTLTSDAALPSDIGAAMVSCLTDTTYEIGHSSAVPNHLFLPRVKALQERVGRVGYPFALAKEAEVVTFPSHWDGAVLEFEVRCDRPVEDIRGMTMGIGRVQKEIAVLTTGANTYALRSEWDSKALSEPFTRVELRDARRKRCDPTVLAVRVRPVLRPDCIRPSRTGTYSFWRVPDGRTAVDAMTRPREQQALEAGGQLTRNPGERIVGLVREGTGTCGIR